MGVRSQFPKPLVALVAAGCGSEILYTRLVRFQAINGVPALYFVGIFSLLFALYWIAARSLTKPSKHPIKSCWPIVVFGLLFRLTLVPAGLQTDVPLREALLDDLSGQAVTFKTFLLYDQDLWRYLWEGHVWASGYNPYLLAPQNPLLDSLVDSRYSSCEVWEEIRDRVSYPDLPALYPPGAQLVFRLSHATFSGSVIGWKLWMILFECTAGLFVALTLKRLGRPVVAGLLLFAWNPLLIKSFAGSGHFDAVLVALLSILAYAWICGRKRVAQVVLGLATLSKFVPVVLFPLLTPPLLTGAAILCGTVVLGYTPFLTEGLEIPFSTLATFLRQWRFNGGPYLLLENILGRNGALYFYAAVVAAIMYRFRKRRAAGLDQLRLLLWLLGWTLILSPVVFPWYVTWLLPLACVVGDRVWLTFSGLVFFAFFVMFDGVERSSILAVEYIILLLVLFFQHWKRRGDALCIH